MESLNKFLTDFAEANTRYGVSNDYKFMNLSLNRDADIEPVFKWYQKLTEEDKVELRILTDWEDEFLNGCPDSEKYWFGKIPEGYDLKGLAPKQYLMNMLLKEMKEKPREIYSVEVYTRSYYACSEEEYVFRTGNGVYLLSLQVHD